MFLVDFCLTLADTEGYETLQKENAKPLLMEYSAQKSAWEAKCAGIKDKLRKLSKDAKNTDEQEKLLINLEMNMPQPPQVPKLIYGDVTPEALKWGLGKDWPSGGIMSSEAGMVLGAHGMNKDSLMRNLATLNQLWDGADISTERRTSESFTVSGARLTIALQVQEPTLRSFCETSGGLARGTGFFARFLVAWPESTQGNRLFKEAPSFWPALEKFNTRIMEILDQKPSCHANGTLSPMLNSFSIEAKKEWINFHDSIERELRAGGIFFDVRDIASKIADNAARMAALFHMFENHGIFSDIGLDSITRAIKIVAWHLHEGRRFYGELSLPSELVDASRLDDWLIDYCLKNQVSHISSRELQRNVTPVRLRKKIVLEVALKELIETQRIKVVENGKTKKIYINPSLLNTRP